MEMRLGTNISKEEHFLLALLLLLLLLLLISVRALVFIYYAYFIADTLHCRCAPMNGHTISNRSVVCSTPQPVFAGPRIPRRAHPALPPYISRLALSAFNRLHTCFGRSNRL